MNSKIIVENIAIAYIDTRGGAGPYFIAGDIECHSFKVTLMRSPRGQGYRLVEIEPPVDHFPSARFLYRRILQVLKAKYPNQLRRSFFGKKNGLEPSHFTTGKQAMPKVLLYTVPCYKCGGFPYSDGETVRCIQCGATLYPRPEKVVVEKERPRLPLNGSRMA